MKIQNSIDLSAALPTFWRHKCSSPSSFRHLTFKSSIIKGFRTIDEDYMIFVVEIFDDISKDISCYIFYNVSGDISNGDSFNISDDIFHVLLSKAVLLPLSLLLLLGATRRRRWLISSDGFHQH